MSSQEAAESQTRELGGGLKPPASLPRLNWLHWLRWLHFFPRPKTGSETVFTSHFFFPRSIFESFTSHFRFFHVQLFFFTSRFRFFGVSVFFTSPQKLERGKNKIERGKIFHCPLFFFSRSNGWATVVEFRCPRGGEKLPEQRHRSPSVRT